MVPDNCSLQGPIPNLMRFRASPSYLEYSTDSFRRLMSLDNVQRQRTIKRRPVYRVDDFAYENKVIKLKFMSFHAAVTCNLDEWDIILVLIIVHISFNSAFLCSSCHFIHGIVHKSLAVICDWEWRQNKKSERKADGESTLQWNVHKWWKVKDTKRYTLPSCEQYFSICIILRTKQQEVHQEWRKIDFRAGPRKF